MGKRNYVRLTGTFDLPESISIDDWIDIIIELTEKYKGSIVGFWEDVTEETRKENGEG